MNFSRHYKMNPWQYLVISFLLLILTGTGLLSLPFVKHEAGLGFVDSLFTSTSAVCVTGLVTLPTSGYNTAGQIIILILIQTGAIGIMTLTSSFLLVLKGKISLKHRLAFSRLHEDFALQDAYGVLKNVLRITFLIEGFGVVLLSIGFLIQGCDVGEALYQGIFHSISAFCNAGFSPYDQSLMGMNPIIKYSIAALIIMGGIGYFVIYEVVEHFKHARKFTLHTRLVIRTTFALVIAGTVLVYFAEGGALSLTDSIFQSVTTRTAGFNSVDMQKMGESTIFILIVLMFIGASPGSTGGGIKTTTFFAMIYSVVSILKGEKQVVIFHRRISNDFIIKSFAVSVLYFIIVSIAILLLLETQNFKLKEIIFEAVSAMGTVGLSLGITPSLNDIGKIIIILLMFIGRLGPASFAMALISKEKDALFHYPEGEIY